jgi:hypothetical protein
MQTLRPRVTTTIRQPPTPVRLYFDGFASKLALPAPFGVLPYFEQFSLNYDRMNKNILRLAWGTSKRETAKALSLIIPPGVLAIADEVIE